MSLQRAASLNVINNRNKLSNLTFGRPIERFLFLFIGQFSIRESSALGAGRGCDLGTTSSSHNNGANEWNLVLVEGLREEHRRTTWNQKCFE